MLRYVQNFLPYHCLCFCFYLCLSSSTSSGIKSSSATVHMWLYTKRDSDDLPCHAMPYCVILSALQIQCIFYFLALTSCSSFSRFSVEFGSDSRLLWSGSTDRTIRVWEIATGRCMGALNVAAGGHTEAVSCLEYIPAIPQASAVVPG